MRGRKPLVSFPCHAIHISPKYCQTTPVCLKAHLSEPEIGCGYAALRSCDLFRCESATLRTHWVLVVMDHFTRRIMGFGVHGGIFDGVALCRMFHRATRGYSLPKYLSSVGSRTGAVLQRAGLSVSPRFLWECLTNRTVSPFPIPAASNPPCGFPAVGFPVCFVARFM
jgi:hypothetical protein